ncbi:MAG TPA: MarR family transcriptional regulator [Candidatus Angelobacter sp.]|jgi:DNA-binding MarR family transcriptional regulator
MPRQTFDLAVIDFGQSIGLLARRVRAAAASHELSWTESSVLRRLAKEGPATTADLARAQGMRPQSMRTVIAALEKIGMIARKPHATDGRQVNIVLTAKGAAEEKSTTEAKRTWLAHVISQLSHEDRDTLFTAGKIIRQLVEGGPQ